MNRARQCSVKKRAISVKGPYILLLEAYFWGRDMDVLGLKTRVSNRKRFLFQRSDREILEVWKMTSKIPIQPNRVDNGVDGGTIVGL
jgi:hypothetical protein